jgi:hypothetical protein
VTFPGALGSATGPVGPRVSSLVAAPHASTAGGESALMDASGCVGTDPEYMRESLWA